VQVFSFAAANFEANLSIACKGAGHGFASSTVSCCLQFFINFGDGAAWGSSTVSHV